MQLQQKTMTGRGRIEALGNWARVLTVNKTVTKGHSDDN